MFQVLKASVYTCGILGLRLLNYCRVYLFDYWIAVAGRRSWIHWKPLVIRCSAAAGDGDSANELQKRFLELTVYQDETKRIHNGVEREEELSKSVHREPKKSKWSFVSPMVRLCHFLLIEYWPKNDPRHCRDNERFCKLPVPFFLIRHFLLTLTVLGTVLGTFAYLFWKQQLLDNYSIEN